MNATQDEAVISALRAHRADETDRAALARLVIVLWRAEAFKAWKGRPVQVLFRLSSQATTKSRRVGQTHPWALTREEKRSILKKHPRTRRFPGGRWWTVGYERWDVEAGRASIVPAPDSGECSWRSDSYSHPFNSIHELVDYLTERALEWRVIEAARPEVPKPESCRRCGGAGRIKLGKNEGVACPLCSRKGVRESEPTPG